MSDDATPRTWRHDGDQYIATKGLPLNLNTEEAAEFVMSLMGAYDAERAARVAAEAKAEWMLHHGGLLNEWAHDWNPNKKQTLIDYLRKRIDAAIDAARRDK